MEVKEVSKTLGLSEDELVKKGVKAYLEMELRKVKAETYGVFSKYKVSSFKELDEKISSGELSETETFEDFTKVDYLESMREKIEKPRVGHIWVKFKPRIGHIKPRDLAGVIKEERKVSGGKG